MVFGGGGLHDAAERGAAFRYKKTAHLKWGDVPHHPTDTREVVSVANHGGAMPAASRTSCTLPSGTGTAIGLPTTWAMPLFSS